MNNTQDKDGTEADKTSSASKAHIAEKQASVTEPTQESTTIIPFDGEGEDPANLVGREVHGYRKLEQPVLLLQCPDGMIQFRTSGLGKTFNSPSHKRRYEICLDENLKEALDSLRRPHRKALKILGAVTAQHEYETILGSRSKHRIIGLRLEEMERLGYISLKVESGGYDETNLSDDELGHYDMIVNLDRTNFILQNEPNLPEDT